MRAHERNASEKRPPDGAALCTDRAQLVIRRGVIADDESGAV